MTLASFDLVQVTLIRPYKFRVNWPFDSGEQVQTEFRNGSHGGHFGFSTRKILAIFNLQLALILSTKYRVSWPFSLGREVQKRFSRWQIWRPFLICNWNDFSCFDL